MRASGVICELNPFHGGHAYLLSRMREQVGEDGCVICLMSGRFVQRGSVAVADPYLRAETAILGGADLVLELPFPWSAAGAEHFALAGVRVLARLGVEYLTFGSESGDSTLLETAACAAESANFSATYAALCRNGIGTTAAYAEALRMAVGAEIHLPAGFPASNDLLGIAYLRALTKVRAEAGHAPAVCTVRREGAGYRDDLIPADGYPSATALRSLLREAACDPDCLAAMLEGTMPEASLAVLLEAVRGGNAPLTDERLMTFFHTYYRLAEPSALSCTAELGGGLAGHIIRSAGNTATAEAFFAALRTKQYTDARLRRGLLFGVTGVTEADVRAMPTHTTLLAATARGCAYLNQWQKAEKTAARTDFSVVTKPADAPAGRQTDLGKRADALFTLCFPTPTAAGDMLRRRPYIDS